MLHLPDEFVWPVYEGGSIGNIPATVAELLGVPFTGLPPLRPALWRPLGNVRRVAVLIIDSMGWNLLEAAQPYLDSVLRQAAVVERLTSVFPSTTVAALSSLWTGLAPAQHGLVGLSLFFPEYAVAAQMLHFGPVFRAYPDALIEAGLEPETFLHGPGFAEQLAAAGVPTHAFKGNEIIDSALSKMHDRGVAGGHGVETAADMFVQMRLLLEKTAGEPLCLYAYWPTIDTLSHAYGWQHPSVVAELRALFAQLQVELLQPLTAAARQDTALIIVADHGQVVSPPDEIVQLEEQPSLQEMLLMRPTGEPRVAYLHARQGYQQDVIDYVNERLGQAMVAVSAEEALAAGLFGPPPHAPATRLRLGDVVAITRRGHLLLTAKEKEKAGKMVGRHGGMTAAEMQVPWLGFRLDQQFEI
jgi:hypothetical protein